MLAIIIDVSYFERLLSAPTPADVMIQLFYSGGWVVFLFVLLWGLWKVWVESRQIRWITQQQAILLAIDVPKETEQTPKAVESLFATIHGTLSAYDRIERYWIGKIQPIFSFEIVSIDGYVQFYVWCWAKYRDVVEAAIYAQYPDAEIAEVPDYTQAVPRTYPADGWDLFGTEFTLNNPSPYPIRSHTVFEDSLSGEYKDPMSGLLEGLAKLRRGEQVWIQITAQPNDAKAWRAQGEKLIKKLIGAKAKPKHTIGGEVVKFGSELLDQMFSSPTAVPPKREKDEPPSMMLHLSPGERVVVEAIGEKLAKVPFSVKIRIIYVGKKEAFSKARTVSTLKGTFGQFTILDQNGFRPYGKVTTKSDYPWQRDKIFETLSLFMIRTLTTRQNSIIRAYRNRSMGTGAPPHILNIEEMATIFHFPVVTVKAPLLKKTEAKRAEPPFTLPVAPLDVVSPPPMPSAASRTKRAAPRAGAPTTPRVRPAVPMAAPEPTATPENLPFI